MTSHRSRCSLPAIALPAWAAMLKQNPHWLDPSPPVPGVSGWSSVLKGNKYELPVETLHNKTALGTTVAQRAGKANTDRNRKMKLSTPQLQMLNTLRRGPISQPIRDRILGGAKMRTLRSLKKLGMVKVRLWDEPRARMDQDDTWQEWSINVEASNGK